MSPSPGSSSKAQDGGRRAARPVTRTLSASAGVSDIVLVVVADGV